METIETMFLNIISMSTIATIVFVLILCAKNFLNNKISFSKSILLWSVFILVLVFPLNFESRLSLKNYLKTNEKSSIKVAQNFNIEENLDNFSEEISFDENDKKVTKINDALKYLSLIWFSVTCLLITKDVFFYNKLLKVSKLEKAPDRLTKIFENCKQKLNISGNIVAVLQEKVKTPSICGIFNTKVFLSQELLELSDEEIECVILHELIHYNQKHHIIYIILTLLKDVHWFNPIVHLAVKIIKNDIEHVTDENVLNKGIEVKKYCKTIVKVASITASFKSLVPTIVSDKKEIERRIVYMKTNKEYTKFATTFLVIAILGISVISVSLASDEIKDENAVNIEIQTSNEDIKILDKKVEFSLPIEGGKVSATFGKRVHPITGQERFHSGVDIVADEGTKVYAIASGKVIYADFDASNGNMVKIEHADGSVSVYKHGLEILVDVGDEVNAGENIMLVGKTGMATGAHLHVEVIDKDGEFVDINGLFIK